MKIKNQNFNIKAKNSLENQRKGQNWFNGNYSNHQLCRSTKRKREIDFNQKF